MLRSFTQSVSSENSIFRNLPRRSSVILGCEVVNHVLAHLTGASVKDSSVEFSVPTYSTKENNIIRYLSGYVFSTIYSRLKFSKATQSMLGMQCLPLFLAGKSSLENSPTENEVVFGMLLRKFILFFLKWKHCFVMPQQLLINKLTGKRWCHNFWRIQVFCRTLIKYQTNLQRK